MAIFKREKKKELNGNNLAKKSGVTLGDLIIPILGLVIFVVLTIFVYVPMLFTGENSYLEMRTAREELKSQKIELESKLTAMDPFIQNSSQITNDLRTVSSVIPTNLDVSDFAFYVDQLASKNSLVFKEVSSGNISVDTSKSSNASLSTRVSGVSGPIVYEGEYSNIVNFLDQLQSESPYIIETSSIFLKLIEKSDEGEDIDQSYWRLEINITGYYIADTGEDVAFNPYQQFIPYTRYSDVLLVFREKAELLK